jgi:hypothetical protein
VKYYSEQKERKITIVIVIGRIIIKDTFTKSYSVYMKYFSEQEERKIIVIVRILLSKSGFKDIVRIRKSSCPPRQIDSCGNNNN